MCYMCCALSLLTHKNGTMKKAALDEGTHCESMTSGTKVNTIHMSDGSPTHTFMIYNRSFWDDLYGLARVTRWDPHDLHGLTHFFWGGSTLFVYELILQNVP